MGDSRGERIALHLRTVQYALLGTCVVLCFAVVDNRKETKTRSVASARQIALLADNWGDELLSELVAETYYAQKFEVVPDVENQETQATGFLLHTDPGDSFILELIGSELKELPFVPKRPSTLGEFRSLWNSLARSQAYGISPTHRAHEVLVFDSVRPESEPIARMKIMPARGTRLFGSLAKPERLAIDFLSTKFEVATDRQRFFGPTVIDDFNDSASNRRYDESWASMIARIRNQPSKDEFALHAQRRDGSEVRVLVEVDRQSIDLQVLLLNHAQELAREAGDLDSFHWKGGEFDETFPSLGELASEYAITQTSRLVPALQERFDEPPSEVQVLGVTLPSETVLRTGIIIVIALQAYMWLHLAALTEAAEASNKLWDVPWIAVYTAWQARAVFLGAAIAFPVATVYLLARRSAWIAVFSCGVSAYLGWLCLRRTWLLWSERSKTCGSDTLPPHTCFR
jgi:hypothetical protein